jgi:hypothetical protein
MENQLLGDLRTGFRLYGISSYRYRLPELRQFAIELPHLSHSRRGAAPGTTATGPIASRLRYD